MIPSYSLLSNRGSPFPVYILLARKFRFISRRAGNSLFPLLKRPSLKEHLRKAKCAMKNKKTCEDTDCIRLETRQTSLISSSPDFSASQEVKCAPCQGHS